MVSAAQLAYFLVHPNQLRDIIQWKLWHDPVHERNPAKETKTLRKCFEFLDLTSRSFSSVIQELNPELLVPVALFYLILRGLDTIEDDMTIPLETKEPLLRDFYKIVEDENTDWNFNGNGPNEKDRPLLVEFEVVLIEFRKIKPVYKAIIIEITKKMGNGMADYANNAEHNENGVMTIEDYELYCHYVAGLVGDGLTRLFVESGLANPALLQRPHLQESMAQLLQQTNVIRDIREDFDDKRRFWPKEIWSKYVDEFHELFEPMNVDIAVECTSEMVLNALKKADECLFYMAGIKDQSVFNFVAIPQSMAIATLELVFQNPNIFKRNVKITKGDACHLMTESSQNLRSVCQIFKRYAMLIHKKNSPKDRNFAEISMACAKIEQFIETLYPQQDPKVLTTLVDGVVSEEEKAKRAASSESKLETGYLLFAMFGTMILLAVIMTGVAYLAGARFDVVLSEILKGNIFPSYGRKAQALAAQQAGGQIPQGHVEL